MLLVFLTREIKAKIPTLGSDYWSSGGANKCHINTEKARADKPNNPLFAFNNLITHPCPFESFAEFKEVLTTSVYEVIYGDTLTTNIFIKSNMLIKKQKQKYCEIAKGCPE